MDQPAVTAPQAQPIPTPTSTDGNPVVATTVPNPAALSASVVPAPAADPLPELVSEPVEKNDSVAAVAASPVQVPEDTQQAATSQPVRADQPPPVSEPENVSPAAAQPESVAEPVSLQNDILTPANAVSGPLKEFGPSTSPPTEFVAASDAEPDIPQEVKEAGVEAMPNTDQPNISHTVQQITGIQPAKDAVPIQTSPSDMIKLPMPEAEAMQTIKTRKVADSIRWLATLILAQAKRAHGEIMGK